MKVFLTSIENTVLSSLNLSSMSMSSVPAVSMLTFETRCDA